MVDSDQMNLNFYGHHLFASNLKKTFGHLISETKQRNYEHAGAEQSQAQSSFPAKHYLRFESFVWAVLIYTKLELATIVRCVEHNPMWQ